MSTTVPASPTPANTTTSAIAALDHIAALRMLGWLSGSMTHAGQIDADDWNSAYGHAADDQTVRAARTVLAEAVS